MKTKMSIRAYLYFGILTFLLVWVSSCEIQEDFEYQHDNIDGKLEVSAWEYIQQNDSLALLENAITSAGLQSFYQDSETRTFIAPNNQSFRDYLQANGYSNLEAIPLPILRNILQYHIVNDKVIFSDPDLAESNFPIAYPTQNGQVMFLSHDTNFRGIINQGTNSQWQIVTSNLEPSNGVIHVVDALVYFSAPAGDPSAPDPSIVTDTIFPIYDTYVNGGTSSGTNYGSDPLIKVKNVTGDGLYDRKAFLMFDLNEFGEEGIITDLQLAIAVSFTHAKGVSLDAYQTPDTTWNEMGLTFDNAVFPDGEPIASITPTRVPQFQFDLTNFYLENEGLGRVSIMLDGEATTDETNDLASKEHPSLHPPMLIARLASGENTLEVLKNNSIQTASGDVFVMDNEILELTGAPAADIIYTVNSVPTNGWLIQGASILRPGDQFTQLDIDLQNLLYINDDQGASEDLVLLSAKDRTGSRIDEITINIEIQ
ncbi:CBM96 family carbohydrate-binding protein [Salegentibacter salegens]|uniref:Cadherin-like n=1 Tax=Salegentibacter salegens TaxID=143223 RepID=A0A1M7MDZ4_9FLAO|nr:DNRLRE domain-containing protein [Salegentibacter salegens]PRX51634.1 cadherin-like protein [Salegentibacter salegens]SHM89022.1 Cadherin-like [Salegentibacter salegens]